MIDRFSYPVHRFHTCIAFIKKNILILIKDDFITSVKRKKKEKISIVASKLKL